MSETIISKYNDFLKNSNLSLDRGKNNVMYRSTHPGILDFISDINSDEIKNILEIGRSNGYSYGFFKFCFPNAKVTSIDIIRTKTSDKVSKLFDDNFLFIDGTSDNLKNTTDMFDIVFIDGDHSFEWCKRDWDNVQNNLSKKSIIIFDDLDWGDRGVERFFNSLKENKNIKYIDNNPIYGVVYRG